MNEKEPKSTRTHEIGLVFAPYPFGPGGKPVLNLTRSKLKRMKSWFGDTCPYMVLYIALQEGARADWTKKQFDDFLHEAMKDDLAHINEVCYKYFDIIKAPTKKKK